MALAEEAHEGTTRRVAPAIEQFVDPPAAAAALAGPACARILFQILVVVVEELKKGQPRLAAGAGAQDGAVVAEVAEERTAFVAKGSRRRAREAAVRARPARRQARRGVRERPRRADAAACG